MDRGAIDWLWRSAIIAALPLGLCTCGPLEELCVPQSADLSFFSRGDCIFTRASFFQGHEWITVLANAELDERHRFSPARIAAVAEGNRRVDWPKELLVHMNNSVVSYIAALNAHTEVPSRQADHFLLTDRNDSAEATAAAQKRLREVTWEAVRYAYEDEQRALAAIGKANHLVQDSFSEAHTRRNVDHPTHPACLVKVKAYIERAPGFDTADIEYHGDTGITPPHEADDDADPEDAAEEREENVFVEGIGHITTQDSIYRKGRECHAPTTATDVANCLSEPAKRARDATRDYLSLMSDLLADHGGTDASASPEAAALLEAYIQTHVSLCP